MGQHKTAVFLDRDGTINVEAGYLHQLDQLQLMPGAAAAIKRLNDEGVLVIVATNQSGPARGYYPESHVVALNRRLTELLAAEGAHVDGVYYCPHLPDGTVPEYTQACACRKPEPGMLVDAARTYDLDLKRCYMVGDKSTDVEVGQRVGCRTVLLRSGYGEAILKGEYMWQVEPDHIADTLVEAVGWMLEDLRARV